MRHLTLAALAAIAAACSPPSGATGEAAAQNAGGGEAAYIAGCVSELTAQNPQARQWAPDECRQRWQLIVAAGPLAEAILASAAGTPPSGNRLGADISVQSDRAARTVMFSWQATGALIPYDAAGALRQRGADVAMIGCSQLGVGEFSKAYQVTPRTGAPFQISVYDRSAPIANSESFYNVTVSLNGQVQTLAQLRTDGMEWAETCPY
ncbi:MAG: hypothetical protein K2P58_12825 [Hyphomonadaceae bacterium]|nr:hypothetical protein [Hyphomonadaceae bacterium]